MCSFLVVKSLEKLLILWYNIVIEKGDFMTEILIHTEYITLGQFLKLSNLISSGGEAKIFIENNKILVNGELTIQRGKKLRNNDEISVSNRLFKIKNNYDNK